MSGLLLIAAESSKVPFYILGGVLVVWAVVLAGLGLSRPAFPGSAGAARGVMGLTVVLVVLAIGAAVVTS